MEEVEEKVRPKYDVSKREYEILSKTYRYDKYTRILREKPSWRHCSYYKTEQGAIDALHDLRRSWLDRAYYDYPGTEYENTYSHIKPTISINRYKAVKRKFN